MNELKKKQEPGSTKKNKDAKGEATKKDGSAAADGEEEGKDKKDTEGEEGEEEDEEEEEANQYHSEEIYPIMTLAQLLIFRHKLTVG